VATANECTSAIGPFDGHGGAPVQYEAHHLMQHDQCSTASHWTPPLGNFSLCITPAAARATINATIMQNLPTLLAVSISIVMRRYYTARIARWRRFMAFIKATKRRHRASTCSNRHQSDMPTPISGGIFHCQIVEKELELPE